MWDGYCSILGSHFFIFTMDLVNHQPEGIRSLLTEELYKKYYTAMEHAEKVLTGADQEDWVLEKVPPGNDHGSESLHGLVLLGKSSPETIDSIDFPMKYGTFRQIFQQNQSIEKDEMMKHVFSVTNCTSRFRFGKHEDEVNNSHCGGPMVIFWPWHI